PGPCPEYQGDSACRAWEFHLSPMSTYINFTASNSNDIFLGFQTDVINDILGSDTIQLNFQTGSVRKISFKHNWIERYAARGTKDGLFNQFGISSIRNSTVEMTFQISE